MRYFVFFYSVMSPTRQGFGSLYFQGPKVPPNKAVKKIAASNWKDVAESDVVISNWIEMTKEDFENYTS